MFATRSKRESLGLWRLIPLSSPHTPRGGRHEPSTQPLSSRIQTIGEREGSPDLQWGRITEHGDDLCRRSRADRADAGCGYLGKHRERSHIRDGQHPLLRSSNTKPTMEIVEVQGGDLTKDLDDATAGRIKRFPNPPFFVRNDDGSRGILNRSCTRDYKITPVQREAKRRIGHQPGKRLPKEPVVEVWIGITMDEIHRMDMSQEPWIQHRFPLVEIGWARHDCDRFLYDLFGIRFGHSGCIDCSFRSPEEWLDMMMRDPDDYERACQDDEKIRHGLPNVKQPAFIHDSLKPLREIDWQAEIERRRGTLLGWGNSCGSGACGL